MQVDAQKSTSIEVSKETHKSLRKEAVNVDVKLKELVAFKLNKPLSKLDIKSLKPHL